MAQSGRTYLASLILVLMAWGTAPCAQTPEGDRPAPAAPVRPLTRQDADHREALKLYGLAQVYERDNKLIQAVRVLERAAQLDPEATAIHRALIPLYLALDRNDEALAACRKALELAPGDYETWYLYARQLRAQGAEAESRAALARAAACPGLKERAELNAQIHFDLAQLYERAQEFKSAATAYRAVLAVLDNPRALMDEGVFSREEIDAQAAETYERLGRVHLRADEHDQAIAAFQAAQRKDRSRTARLAYNLAEVHLARNNLPAALAALDEYLLTQPTGTEAYERKIAILEQLGRQHEIVPALEQYARRDPHNVSLQVLLGRQYERAGRRDQAERLFRGLVEKSPGPEAYRGLIDVYKNSGAAGLEKILRLLDSSLAGAKERDGKPGNPADAATARAVLLVLRDDSALLRELLPLALQYLPRRFGRNARPEPALDAQTRHYLAVLAARTRLLDEAESLYRSCLDERGGFPRAAEHEIYSGLLRVLWQAHKYEAIAEVCRRGLAEARATNRVLFHADLASALMHLGKTDEAIAQATEAVGLATDDNLVYCRRLRANLLAQAGRCDEAVADCQALLQEYAQPKHVRDIRYTLSSVYSTARQFAKAEEQLQLILQADPADATAHNDLGYIWADQGKNLEEAERLIRRALELDRKQKTTGTAVGADTDQDNAAYVDSLGWVLFKRGRFEEARRELERAAALPGGADDPVVWDHLGDVHYRLKDEAKARAAWKKAIELYEIGRRRPRDERYNEIQQKLKP